MREAFQLLRERYLETLRKELFVNFMAIILLLLVGPSAARSESADPPSREATKMGSEMLLFNEVESVYGASQFEQKVTEAPSSITIFTADQIKK
jgi:outer membrane receptor for ferrienterochelin and colicins